MNKDLRDAVSNNRVDEIISLGPEVIPELIKFFLIKDPPEIRQNAASMIECFGEDAIQPLIAALESPHEHMRRKSAVTLGEMASGFYRKPLSMPEAVEPIILRLQDGQSSVQIAAAWALLRIHKTTDVSKAIPALVALFSDDNMNVRSEVVLVLSHFGKAAIPQLFVAFVNSPVFYIANSPARYNVEAFTALRRMDIKDEKFKKIICEWNVAYASTLKLAETHQVIDGYYREIEQRGNRQEIIAYRKLSSEFYRDVVREKNARVQWLALSDELRPTTIKPPHHGTIYRMQTQRRLAT